MKRVVRVYRGTAHRGTALTATVISAQLLLGYYWAAILAPGRRSREFQAGREGAES